MTDLKVAIVIVVYVYSPFNTTTSDYQYALNLSTQESTFVFGRLEHLILQKSLFVSLLNYVTFLRNLYSWGERPWKIFSPSVKQLILLLLFTRLSFLMLIRTEPFNSIKVFLFGLIIMFPSFYQYEFLAVVSVSLFLPVNFQINSRFLSACLLVKYLYNLNESEIPLEALCGR